MNTSKEIMYMVTHHVTFIRANVLLGVSAQATVNIAIFSADQIPAQQLAATSTGINMTSNAFLTSSENHVTPVFK